MDKRAAAYLRRSSVSEGSPGDVSRDAQLHAVRGLAEANGVDPDSLIIFEDWGKSADETKREKRTQYLALLKAIESRSLDYVFVYHLDRIIRSVADFTDLHKIADGHTTILTPTFPLTGTDPMAKAFAQVAAVFAELELNRIKQRNRKALAVRVARGDVLGHPTWGMMHVRNGDGQVHEVPDPDKAGDVAAVLQAVRDAGTMLGAVRTLNARGARGPKGGEWHASALARIVKAHAPDLLQHRSRKGRPAGPALLRGLVKCHCGQIMTPNAARRQLYCYVGNRDGVAKHGRAHVREVDVYPWISYKGIERELMGEHAVSRDRLTERLAEAEGRLERLGYALVDGLLKRHEARTMRAEIEREIAETKEALDNVPPEPANLSLYSLPGPLSPDSYDRLVATLDATGIEVINKDLRSKMKYVQLDNDMKPVHVEWRT